MSSSGPLQPGGSNGYYSSVVANGSSANVAPPPGTTHFAASSSGMSSSAAAGTNGPGSLSSAEEISTIFVVGFPDDMQEREFQNMFIFSPGFEAATLKVPSKDQDDENAATSGNNSRKQIVSWK